MWRGGVGTAYLLPALSSAGASLAAPGLLVTRTLLPASVDIRANYCGVLGAGCSLWG
jgi:hypothetical protein